MYHYLIFSALYLPSMGGVENYTYNLSKYLIRKGHKVTVVTCNTACISYYEEINGVQVYRYNCLNLLNGRYPVYKPDSMFRKINSELSEQHFDFCIVNTRFYTLSLFGAKFASKRNIPHIVIDHGSGHLTVNNKILDFFGEKYEHAISYRLKKYCDHFYGVSNASCRWLKHFNIDADGVIYNAIDLEKIIATKLEDYISIRDSYKIPNNAIVFTYTGRLVKEKGLMQLIKSFKKLQAQYDNCYLVFAGDGLLEEYVTSNLDEHFIWLKRISFDEVIHLLQESDVFCLPSDSEGFSTSLIEAVACECYILTTNQGGAKEVIIDDSYGLVMNDNKEETVYESLKKVYLNNNRDQAIRKAYKRLEENFTWDIISDRVIQLVDSGNIHG